MDRCAPRGRRGARPYKQAHRSARRLLRNNRGPAAPILSPVLRSIYPRAGSRSLLPQEAGTRSFFRRQTPTCYSFRDVSLYTETISSPAQAPAAIHQLHNAAAYAGRRRRAFDPARCVINGVRSGSAASLPRLGRDPEIIASEAEIAEIACRIDEAGSIVIMCGAGCHGAAGELRALSDRLKAPLISRHALR